MSTLSANQAFSPLSQEVVWAGDFAVAKNLNNAAPGYVVTAADLDPAAANITRRYGTLSGAAILALCNTAGSNLAVSITPLAQVAVTATASPALAVQGAGTLNLYGSEPSSAPATIGYRVIITRSLYSA